MKAWVDIKICGNFLVRAEVDPQKTGSLLQLILIWRGSFGQELVSKELPQIAPNLHMLLFHHHICSSSRTFVVKGGIFSNTCEEVLAVHCQGYYERADNCESWSVNIKSVDIMGLGIMLNGCYSNKYWDERVFVLLCFKLPPCFKSKELL